MVEPFSLSSGYEMPEQSEESDRRKYLHDLDLITKAAIKASSKEQLRPGMGGSLTSLSPSPSPPWGSSSRVAMYAQVPTRTTGKRERSKSSKNQGTKRKNQRRQERSTSRQRKAHKKEKKSTRNSKKKKSRGTGSRATRSSSRRHDRISRSSDTSDGLTPESRAAWHKAMG
jgi:hypothetical protein